MTTINDIISNFKFSSDSPKKTIKETIDVFECTIKGKITSLSEITAFEKNLLNVSERDKLQISININTEEKIIISSDSVLEEDHIRIGEFIKDSLEDKDADTDVINVEINKHIADCTISIYDLSAFYKYINELKLVDFFKNFQKHIGSDTVTKFKYQTANKSFWTTHTFQFGQIVHSDIEFISRSMRIEVLKYREDLCLFHLKGADNLIPEDFKIINSNFLDAKVAAKFNEAASVLLTSFLFSFIRIDNDVLEFKIRGVKSISGQWKLSQEAEYQKFVDKLFPIYEWCYSSGKQMEKIGIIRNILSLHITSESEWEITGDPFFAIQSSFKIYLTENVQQYLAVKEGITNKLMELSNFANDIAQKYIQNFKNSIFAFISFFTSVFVVKFISKKASDSIVSIFTNEIILLSFGFLVLTTLFLFFSKKEFQSAQKRVQELYNAFKNSYEDVLYEEDIDRILQNDKIHVSNTDYVNAVKGHYSQLWFWIIFTFLIILGILFLLNNGYF